MNSPGNSASPISEKSSVANRRPKIFRKFHNDVSLASPACRTVLIQSFVSRESFDPGAKCEFVSIVHPVVAIESRIELRLWAYADEMPGTPIECAAVAGIAKAGYRISSREVVHGAIFVHPEYGLTSTLDVAELGAPEERLTVVACPWSELSDGKHLQPIIDNLRVEATKGRQEIGR